VRAAFAAADRWAACLAAALAALGVALWLLLLFCVAVALIA
jgi:hypothetical protein